MEMHIDEKNRIVEIWLTRAEKDNESIRELLKPIYKKWKSKKYLPVVFESGDGDLQESIIGLLRHNREVIAKRQLEEERQIS